MKALISDNIRKARIKKKMSQQDLATALNVDRSTVSGWETGKRKPDISMVERLSAVLDIPVQQLIADNKQRSDNALVIMIDDESIILNGGIPIIQSVMPNAEVVGFTKPSEAIEYAKSHSVDLVFLDIELGRVSGLDICKELLAINPRTGVIYLTAFREYSFDAWSTGACGFLLKPLTVDAVWETLARLRNPLSGGDSV